MNLGQSTLAIVALVVITFLVVSANRIIIQSREDELKGEAFNQAGEIASDLISEALKKKFDNPLAVHSYWDHGYLKSYKLYDFYQDSTDFTAPGSLGPNSNESAAVPLPDRYPYKSISGYDDFDDYDGYQRIVDTPIMTGFVVNCTVVYVDAANLNNPVNYCTYYKRLVVNVSHPVYLPDGLTFSTIMTY